MSAAIRRAALYQQVSIANQGQTIQTIQTVVSIYP
jgi:hypothetical protein